MRRDAIPMVGKRYGAVKVLAEAGNVRLPSQIRRMVRVRCGCGSEWTAAAQSIRRGDISR